MPCGACQKFFHTSSEQLHLSTRFHALHFSKLQDISWCCGFAQTVAFAYNTLPSSLTLLILLGSFPTACRNGESFLSSDDPLPVRLGGGKETSALESMLCAGSHTRHPGPSSSQHHSTQALGACLHHDLITCFASVTFVLGLREILGCGNEWKGRIVGCWVGGCGFFFPE